MDRRRRRLEALRVALGLQASCAFMGALPDGIACLAAADITVATSLYESFGLSVLEAMACGRPVVASAVDGLRDLITDGQEEYLVPPGDADGMAARLIELARDPARREAMGSRGRRTSERYAGDAIPERYRALILEVAAELPPRAGAHGQVRP